MRPAPLRACWLIATLIAMLLCGCAGQGASLSGAANRHSALASPVLLGASAKGVSGAPVGIWTRWTRDASGEAQGYYLYRDTQSIPDPPSGLLDPALRVNAGNMIAQPPSGPDVNFNDIFSPVVGQTYYYRVTVVDALDQESDPSNEVSWTVHGHNVTGLNPTSCYWGESITILGDTFGAYNATTDFVRLPLIGGGEIDAVIEQPSDWTDTAITVTVPDNTITGKVQVVIDSTIAESDNDLTILNAWIGDVTPNPGFLEQEISITGGNYGAVKGASVVLIGGIDVGAAVTFWGPTEIKLDPPANVVEGAVQVTVAAHSSNQVLWTPRPQILSAAPLAPEAGEPMVLNGRLFGGATGEVLLDGVTPVSITSWSAAQILITVSGSSGAHTLVVKTAGDLTSNGYNFDIVDPLAVSMSGLVPDVVYRPPGTPAIGVTAPLNADSVELLIDGVVWNTVFSPFTGLALPTAALSNGTHSVKLVAHRRAIDAESATVDVTVYSLEGDIDGDGVVGDSDRDALVPLIGMLAGDSSFWPWYDTDDDGIVTEADLALVGYNYGNMLPPPLP